jgi:hypothetical protein
MSAGLPDPPETLVLLQEGLHGLRLQVPLDRDRLPQYAAVVLVLVSVPILLGVSAALLVPLVPAVFAAWWLLLPDRRDTELALDGDAITLTFTELGVPTTRRVALVEVDEVTAASDPPELVIRTATHTWRLPWGGTPAELGWLAAAIRHQLDAIRGADPVPPPPPELEQLRHTP